MHVLILQARYGGLELHKTGYHVLVNYVNIINNTRNVDISPELGAVAVPKVPYAIRPAVCLCAELRLMQVVWLAVNATLYNNRTKSTQTPAFAVF
jgi:hypothetical protein